ncbi:lipoate--protein ligase family protein [Geobacter grbiciae]|uniref:lipoate--protein ligase family protein n=1 Tax=Geobacter grbiciae TaxID=155042 RepID=UPI001C02B2FB|nr:lipoate--protein ligase family protein [Geobacter grbiciae]MBT1074809.1 lipoate--protein ligase family protein [Geobacter grbiciae]
MSATLAADGSPNLTRWRLVDTGPLDGPANMAVDEALLLHFDPAASLPVLRLYGWEPPAFSVGRFQRAEDALHLERCAAAGIPVVRRITGGGVIYHAAELTYAVVCAPRHISDAQGVKESFRALTGFLLRFYGTLGFEASWAVDSQPPGKRLGVRTPLCFAGQEEYDIVSGGRKIGGNAQRRLKDVIFQHGSVPLRCALAEALPFFRQPPAGLQEGATSLAQLGVTADSAWLRERLVAAFAESLGVDLVSAFLTAEEKATAARLGAERYGKAAWNLHGETP